MKKRIALVVNSLSGGGAEKTVSNLSRGLADQYDVDIIVNDEEHLDYPYKGRIISLHLPPNMERMGAAYQLLALAKRTRVLRHLKRSRKYIAVLSFSEMANTANVLSGNKYARTIVSVRIAVGERINRGIKQKLFLSYVLPFVCRKADITVSCSKEIGDDLAAHYGLLRQKSTTIYNGLELPRIWKKAAEPLSEQEKSRFQGQRLIVSVGRMTNQKGQWHLLKAVKKLRDDGLPVQLLILGDGELRPALEENVAELSLSDCVCMPGFVKNPYKYMALADVVVVPSLYEGFSNVILEAMACGAPVISTDHETGAREIIAPGTDYREKIRDSIDECEYGLLVPVCEGSIFETIEISSKEEALMAEAIQRILTDDERADRYRQASLKRSEQLSIDTICRQWINVIEAG